MKSNRGGAVLKTEQAVAGFAPGKVEVMLDSELPMFSVPGLKGDIESLIATLAAPKSDHQLFQVEMLCEQIEGQMRRLLRPIRRPDKTGSRSPAPEIYPALDSGMPVESIGRIQNLAFQCGSAFKRGDVARASQLAEEALSVLTP